MTPRPGSIRSQLSGLQILTTAQILETMQEAADDRGDFEPVRINAAGLRKIDAIISTVRGQLADAMASREARS